MHNSVLLNEILQYLQPKNDEIYVDATFGAGGYSKAILDSANCKIFAIDRDLNAIKIADEFKEKYKEKFCFLRGNFSQIKELLPTKKVNGIIFDLGVSSMQFDQMERGFSFNSDSRLDMRMDQENSLSAYEIINEFEEKKLAEIIKEFGDEKRAKLIAKKITKSRDEKPITSCRELASIVRTVYPGYFKIDPATRTFQALRIFVNKELEELSFALNAISDLLNKDGRLIVVSFHSLEDIIVKNFLKKEAGIDEVFSRYEPTNSVQKKINFKIINKSAIKPCEDEIKKNIRSRSAKMRVAIKL